jgi:GNAT superfamily N-acetyltransferase
MTAEMDDGSGRTIAAMTEPTPLAIRPASPSDAAPIAALFTAEGYPAGTSDIVTRLERFSTEHSQVIVGDVDGQILGFVAVHLLPRFEHGDLVARVMALVVAADARERGVGHRLMEAAEGIAVEAGAAFIEVTAGHHRPDARRLYESLGYDASLTTYLRKRL